MLRPPIICLVTERRRLPPPCEDSLVRLVRAAARAGVTLIQVRERDLDDRRLSVLVHRLVEAAADAGGAVVVNDRADVARAAGANGVHLRADSPPAARVRSIVPGGFLIGRSVHGVTEAVADERAGGSEYLVMGTVFATASKPEGSPVAGLEGLAAACRSVRLPVLAIGGVRPDNLPAVAAAGAAGIAGIGLFCDLMRDRDVEDLDARLASLVDAVRRAFRTDARPGE